MEKKLDARKLSDQIIHKIYNSINFMSIKTQMILMNQNASPDSLGYANRVKEELDRMGKLVGSLNKVALPHKGSNQVVQMNKLLDSILAIVENELPLENIEIVKNYDPELPEVSMDSQSFYELLYPIIENSIFAMNGRGVLTFNAHKTHDDGKDFVQIEISDTGCGISDAELSRVLDPFYTTKKESNYVGLGLTLCQAIVENQEGTMKVESEAQKGTTVSIEFPVA